MPEFIAASEPAIRLGFFLGIFAGGGAMGVGRAEAGAEPAALAALVRQYRHRRAEHRRRAASGPDGPGRAGGGRGGTRLGRLESGRAAVLGWRSWIAVVVLDLVIYLQHVMVHAVPVLWRLHRMHHADLDFDVTTGSRFHPFEILLSVALKLAAVIVIGPAALAVVIFEVLLNGTSMFNHGNLRLPAGLDRVLRLVSRHPRHAPRPPLRRRGRDQQQFRLQLPLVGPPLRHLPAPSPRWATRR